MHSNTKLKWLPIYNPDMLIMKKILFLLLVSTSLPARAQQKAKPAREILSAAYKRAAEEHKNVFVIFQASWCGWCRKMDASMADSSCKKFFDDNYVTVHLTVHENDENKKNENPGADEILKTANAFDTGIPFWLVYNSEGKLLATGLTGSAGNKQENIGCLASEKEVNAFVNILKNTSNLTDKALEVIAVTFRKNDDR